MLHAHLKGYPTRGLTLIAHAVLLALCGAASAQETPAPEAPAQEAPAQEAPTGELQAEATTVGLETVVVTAQKKAENLQVVPISVAAVTGQDIADLQASRLDSLAGTVPNVQIGTFSNTPNTASIYIRGIGVNEPDPYAGNTVSIVTDGVPQFFSMGALLDLHDVERIEVLRGPQGTLFGANTTGGVVNVVNAQPQREFGGKFDVSYGDWEHTTVGLVLTGPLSDTISGRIGFRNDRREGWIKDVVDGSTIGDRDVSVFRGALKFEPSDNFDATITAEYDRARNGSPAVVAGNRPGDAALGIPADVEFVPAGWRDMYVSPCPPDGGQCRAPDDYSSAANHDAEGVRVPDQSDMDTYYGNLSMNWYDTAIGDITSITGYKDFKLFEYTDQDGTPAVLIDTERQTRGWQFSEELRTNIKPTDRLELLIGGFYMQTHYDHYQHLRIDFGGGANYDLTNDTYTKGLPGLFQRNLQDQDNWSGSVFAQSYFNITDALRLQAGVRYTHEDTEMLASTLTNIVPYNHGVVTTFDGTALDGTPNGFTLVLPDGTDTGVVVGGLSAPPKGSQSWDNVGWKVGFDYQFGEAQMAYLTWARGFKSGGFSGRIGLPTDLGPYDPEEVDTYEVGIKTDLLDRRLRTNAAVFYTDYRDMQLAQIYFDGTLQGNTILNAGSSTIQGVELEVAAVPVDGLTLTGSLAYLKAEYDKFIYTTSNYAPAGEVRTLDMHGQPLQNAPEWTGSVGAEYVFPVAGGDGRINLQYTYQDEKLLSSIEDVGRARIQAMEYLNGNIDWKPASGDFTIGIWGRNILDKRYINSVLDLPGTLGLTQYAPPREYGVSFSYNW